MKHVKVVITGGPSGGKTTLIQTLEKELGHEIAVVPEAASILYRGGFPRKTSANSAVHGQKSIYFVQQELEELILTERKKSPLLVCDRGSLDGIAYWPRSADHFLETLHTTRKKELARYDWVLHLDTAPPRFYDTTNPIRTESYKLAAQLNAKVKKAWAGHPRRFIITQNEDFLSKMTVCMSIIQAILDGKTADKIRRELLPAEIFTSS